MAKKRTSLAAVTDALMTEPSKPGASKEKADRSTGKKAASDEALKNRNAIAKASQDGQTIRTSVYIPLGVYKKLNELAISESSGLKKKVNDYFLEGIDEVFARRAMPSIAELIRKTEE